MRHVVDVRELIGRPLTDAIVGWHVHGRSRSEVLLFLRSGPDLYEVWTAGDGSLQLDGPKADPRDFHMDQYGSFTFEPADELHLLHPLRGSIVRRVRRLHWRQMLIGWRVETDVGQVLLANVADDIYLSTGALPVDYLDATVSDE